MKVVFDISWLGHECGSEFQGGIERMIFEMTDRLAASEKVELTLAAAESYDIGFRAKKRREKFRSAGTARFRRSRGFGFYERFRNAAAGTERPFTRKFFSGLSKLAALSGTSCLSPEALDGADIFHSPFSSLPDAAVNRTQRFLTVHDMLPVFRPEFSSAKFTERFMRVLRGIRQTDYLICVSNHTRDQLCGYLKRSDAGRVFVIYPGVSAFFRKIEQEEAHSILKRLSLPRGRFVFAILNQRRKNIDRLIESFNMLIQQEKIDDLYLVLAGTPHFLKNKETGDRVRFCGYVSDEELRALYSNALMFVYPSLYEGFGMPVVEAMKCGTPVIASRSTSLPEIIGDAGVLVDPEKPEELSRAMHDFYRSESLREEYSGRGMTRAQLFTWDRSVDETIAAYQKAAG